MAVDEAILQSVTGRQSPPTLRLYAWNPPCLSIGYGQKAADVDMSRLAARGWGLVRRSTGGRAILHSDELTYSLSLPGDDELAVGSVIESYRRISAALVAGLSRLGLQVQADRRAGRAASSGAVCFETPSHYEITVRGRKLVGSAQLRRQGGVLQHGALPLTGDLGRICDGLVYPDEAAREAARSQVRARAITLGEALDSDVSSERVAQAIIEGFVEAFGIDFVPDSLTPEEQARAAQLERDVYSNPAWTHRR